MTQRLLSAQKTFISYNRVTVPAPKVLTADVFRTGVVECNVSIPLCLFNHINTLQIHHPRCVLCK
jgi:hypothetical protein